MSQQTSQSVSALRAVVFRISSIPPKQLPKVAPHIASSIWNCRNLLSLPAESHRKDSDASNVLTRFKAHLSTLLQDRTIQGRWSAIVLVKATIEAGGLEVLRNSNAWVRGLLGILKKPDPPTTRILAAITLTRIFMLTWDYSDLVRTITTPALTTFVATCLVNIENKRCSASELLTVLEAFASLLPKHPTIFRTNESKLRITLCRILSGDTDDHVAEFYYTEAHKVAAERLWAALHHCTPKQGASDKWNETLRVTVEAAHTTCDQIFRCIEEDWHSIAGIQHSRQQILGDVQLEGDDAAGLKPWQGVYAGAERLCQLFRIINAHLVSSTSATVSVPIGLVNDLLTRVSGIVVPHSGKQDFVKFNNQISRDEREALFSAIPQIHAAAMQVYMTFLDRSGSSSLSGIQSLLDQATYIFRSESSNTEVRVVIYDLLTKIVDLAGPSMSKGEVLELVPIVRASCQELLPDDDAKDAAQPSAGGIKQQLGLSGGQAQQTHPTNVSALPASAKALLCAVLRRLDALSMPPKLRAQIDRVAVLTRDEKLLFASVMNPPKKQNDARIQSSLLPILARESSDSAEAEAIMRPRMPPIRPSPKTTEQINGYGEDAEAVEEEEEEDVEVDEDVSESEKEDHEQRNHSFPDVAAAQGVSAEDNDQLNPVTSAGMDDQASKRRAETNALDEAPAKRIRASPVAASLLPDSMRGLSGLQETGTAGAAIVAVEPSSSYQTAASQQTVVVPSHDAYADDSDDSDFEMPTLTAEPDTDPEDEDA